MNKRFTNLRNCLRSCDITDFEIVYVDYLRSKGRCLDRFYFSFKPNNDILFVLQWVVMRNKPFTEINNRLTRNLLNADRISSKTFLKYIRSPIPLVEEK